MAAKDEKPTRSALYAEAEKELRERHEGEFQTLVKEKYSKHGYTYVRKLSASERDARRAEEKRQKLIARRAEIDKELGEMEPVEASADGGAGFAGGPMDRTPVGSAHPVSPEDQAAWDASAEAAGV